MSDVSAPSYSIAANLRWFALIYLAALIVVVILVVVLENFGVTLPSTGLGLGLYAGVVATAGQRFAQRRDWSGRDRNLLSLGYTIVAAGISCGLAGALLFVDPAAVGIGDAAGLTGIIAIAALVVGLIYYGMARLMLMLIARRVSRTPTTHRGST